MPKFDYRRQLKELNLYQLHARLERLKELHFEMIGLNDYVAKKYSRYMDYTRTEITRKLQAKAKGKMYKAVSVTTSHERSKHGQRICTLVCYQTQANLACKFIWMWKTSELWPILSTTEKSGDRFQDERVLLLKCLDGTGMLKTEHNQWVQETAIALNEMIETSDLEQMIGYFAVKKLDLDFINYSAILA